MEEPGFAKVLSAALLTQIAGLGGTDSLDFNYGFRREPTGHLFGSKFNRLSRKPMKDSYFLFSIVHCFGQ
jgi:hypothetical protein